MMRVTPRGHGAESTRAARVGGARSGSYDNPVSGKASGKSAGFLHLLTEVWPFVRPQRWLLFLGFGLMAINRVAGLALPASTKFLVDNVVGKRQVYLLGPLALAILAATAIQGVTSYTLTQLLSKAAQRMIADLRRQVQAHIGRLSIAFHDANKTGALVTRIMSDVEGLRNLIGTGLVEFVGSVMTGIFALIVLLRISAFMTGIAFAILVGFGIALNRAIGMIRPIYRARSKLNAEVTGRLTESLAGVRVVKGYHAEDREEGVFAGGVQRLLENVLKTLTATSVMSLSATVLLGVVSALIMYLGARRILSGAMSLGTYVEYVAFLAMLIAPVFQIVNIGTQLTEGMAGLERTREILRENREDADPRRTVAIPPVTGEVTFEDVGFAYNEGKQVLYDVSFLAPPGTVTALVGPSGAGKSTIIGLIAAFHVPTSGRVLVDGVDLATVRLDSYRVQLGVVLQDTFLFDGTIRENVAFSRPSATEQDILAACRIARVDEFAESFPDKYDTVVGERGVRLSGGQRQRISIARAILADPRILILDEATSSLDSESEALIQEGLSYLMRGRTTFVIAHRLSTIRRADQILVVEAGKIIERGTHELLYALGGRYFELYTKQHGLQANLFLAPGEGDSVPEDSARGAAPDGSPGDENDQDEASLRSGPHGRGDGTDDGKNGGGSGSGGGSGDSNARKDEDEPSIARAARLLRGTQS
jgi:subfamily B ATP-binding cassette protein MsbA